MDQDTARPLAVSRRIGAPASELFSALATPSRHLEFDGSGMLRATDYEGEVGGVGDVFLMRMFNDEFGDYVMRNEVVEFEPDRLIAWAPRCHDVEGDDDWQHRWRFELEPDGPGAAVVTETYDLSRSPDDARRIMKDGTIWLDGMRLTLERLEEAVTSSGS